MCRIFVRNLISILLLGMILGACGPVTSVPTIQPSEMPTLFLSPTITPSPYPSPTATVTPFPALSGSRPFLMFEQEWMGKKFAIYDANGTGRKLIELPPDGYILERTQGKAISPDGQWLVFYSGNYETRDTPEDLPITLKLLNINDGTVKEVSNVLTVGYDEKLNQMVEELRKLDPERYKPLDGNDWVKTMASSDFFWSIYSVAWSPDSRMLAFVAQIDGLSSDVYLYNLELGNITRVEDSLQSVVWIGWSPDGKQIVFENSIPGAIPGADFSGFALHAVRLGRQAVKEPEPLFSGAYPFIGNWLSPSTLLIAYGTDTAGSYCLSSLNINTGELKSLWPDFFGGVAVDYENQAILLNASNGSQFEELGLYIITFDGTQRKILDGYYELTLFFRGGKEHRFLMQGETSKDNTWIRYPIDGDVVGISLDGNLTRLGKFDFDKISISPDYAWLAMYNDKELFLYDENDELVKAFQIPGIQTILWRPDSQAIFYTVDSRLFTLTIPNGESRFVDECLCSLNDAIWLP